MRMGMCWRRKNIRLRVCAAVAAFLAASVFILKRLEPAFVGELSYYASDAVAEAVSGAVYDTFDSGEYGDFSEIISDSSGKIAALEADGAEINRLKSEVTLKVRERLKETESDVIYLPLMSASGLYLLHGAGPKLPFRIMPVGLVTTDIEESLGSAGINQTEHRLSLRVRVRVAYRGLLLSKAEDIETSVPIIDTVINGDVPKYYGAPLAAGFAED